MYNSYNLVILQSAFNQANENQVSHTNFWMNTIGETLVFLACFGILWLLFSKLSKKPNLRLNLNPKHILYFALVFVVWFAVDVLNIWYPQEALWTWIKVCLGLLLTAILILWVKYLLANQTSTDDRSLQLRNSELETSNEALTRINESYHEMMIAARIGNWELDLIAQSIFWSPVVYDIHEVEQDTVIELAEGINFYHPDHQEAIETAVNRCIEYGEPWDLELKIITANGKHTWVRTIGKGLKTQGKVVKLRGLFQDINDSKLKQERIEENEQRLLEGQSIGKFGTWKWDMVNNDLQWSEELYVIFGQKPQAFGATYEAFMSIIHPQDREDFSNNVDEAIKTKRPHDIIHRITWPNGEVRYVHERGRAYYDAEGEAIRMTGTTQDITELMVAQQGILESTAILKDAEQIAHLGNWKWYLDENVHVWSDERYRILGLEPQSVSPSLDIVLETIHEDDRETINEQVTKALAKKEDYSLEYRLQLANGEVKMVKEMARWRASIDNIGKGVYIGTVQDVSAEHEIRKELTESLSALKRSNDELQNFAYVASHDLQEPLRVITSYLQLISKLYNDKLDEEGMSFIESTVNACTRMKTLINDLLTLSRLESTVSRRELVDCQVLTRSVCEDLQISIEESGAKVVYENLPEAHGDPAQLRQLFQNLIGNALKFRKPDTAPVIHITGKRSRGKTKFVISDNGIGIEGKYFKRIFEVFQRLHNKDEFKGTGIGLAICKKIVLQHEGKISVKSEPGQGTSFTFTIKG